MISSEYPPGGGGSGVYVREVSKRLVQIGFKVTVLTRGSIPFSKRYTEDGVDIFRIYCPPLYPFHVEIHRIFVAKIFRMLENEFDIIHYHSPLVPFIDSKLRKISTIHGTVIGGVSAMQAKDLRSIFSKIFINKFIKLEKEIIANSNFIMPISQNCRDELLKKYKVRDIPLSVVCNGVDTSFFTPNCIEGLRGDHISILYVGRIDSQKGLVDLVKCIDYLVKNHKMSIVCTIAGSGPYEASLKDAISKLGLNEFFDFRGRIDSRETIRDLYRNSDIFILPSYYEGFPTVLLEAMSCEMPTIATDVGGIPEIIQHNKTGILIPPNSPIIMANSIMTLLQNGTLTRSIRKNARLYIIKNFDWEIIIKKLVNIYERNEY